MNTREITQAEMNLDAQYRQFVIALPELKRNHAGKWVVWFGGFQSAHESEDDAERWALQNLGRAADFVIARAVEPEIIPLSGLAPLGVGPCPGPTRGPWAERHGS